MSSDKVLGKKTSLVTPHEFGPLRHPQYRDAQKGDLESEVSNSVGSVYLTSGLREQITWTVKFVSDRCDERYRVNQESAYRQIERVECTLSSLAMRELVRFVARGSSIPCQRILWKRRGYSTGKDVDKSHPDENRGPCPIILLSRNRQRTRGLRAPQVRERLLLRIPAVHQQTTDTHRTRSR